MHRLMEKLKALKAIETTKTINKNKTKCMFIVELSLFFVFLLLFKELITF